MLCCLAALPLALAADASWVEVRSPHFSVITDAGEKRGRDVALHFEQMRSVFGSLMTKANENLPVPLQILAFRNTKEMRQVSPLFNGRPTEVAGLFQRGYDRSFIILDLSVENPWSVVFHEYAHQLLEGNLSGRLDPWFEEGFAEYFSSIEVDNKEARVGKIPEETYRILQQTGMMRVADLFRVQQNSRTYNESGDHRETFYAESALVVHYLYDNKLFPKLTVYFNALENQKMPVEQAIQAGFGMTAEQFDKALRDYLGSGKYRYFSMATPAGIVAAQFTTTPVSAADARALVADVHAHSVDYLGQALTEFEDVLKTAPDNAAALRGAGFVCMQQKDYERAEGYLRRAVERNSQDARVHYYYAMLLSQEGPLNSVNSDQIKRELEKSIALDPSLADAYSMLGFVQAFSGEPDKGIASLKRALELSPRNERYLFNLASVWLANQRVDDAITLLRRLAGSADAELSLRAHEALEQAMRVKDQSGRVQWHVEKGPEAEKGPQAHQESAKPPTEEESPVKVVPVPPPPHFIKGKLATVDCSAAPQAVLTVAARGKFLKIHVRDRTQMVLIGADQFSCDWANRSVAVNYRERPDGDGDAVSLEMQ